MLAIPKLGSLRAEFESLKIKGISQARRADLQLCFPRGDGARARTSPTAYTPKSGETLWDVSYRFDIVIDRLVALNPWVKRPGRELDGREVALC